MRASELRIGNLVTDKFYDSFKTVIEIESVDEKGVNLSIEDDGRWAELADRWIEPEYRIDLLFGIPLTEEWLLKFRFKEYKDFGHKTGCFDYINYGFSYLIDTKKIRIMHKGNNISHILQHEVHYVHQLQNLYFALTGEELTIKEL
jgi:hypothetical protein